jgi:hypothetical protein
VAQHSDHCRALPPLAAQVSGKSKSKAVASSDGIWAGKSPAAAFAGLSPNESLAAGLMSTS